MTSVWTIPAEFKPLSVKPLKAGEDEVPIDWGADKVMLVPEEETDIWFEVPEIVNAPVKEFSELTPAPESAQAGIPPETVKTCPAVPIPSLLNMFDALL